MLLFLCRISKYCMNTSKRKNYIQIRMSDSEIQKFKQLSKSLGLTLSGFARYSMTMATENLNQLNLGASKLNRNEREY